MNTEGPHTRGKPDLLGYICVDRMPGHAAVMRVQLVRALLEHGLQVDVNGSFSV